ncbi:hypothetical protein NLO88_05400 [Pseudomonas syringae]|nr:hypothetical protein [Pseudomonas syringae]MCQ3001020.1 hypothetical protein [Pseudomonas syringae]MCQ3030088.1 hypothetical protein [Pseudomonas syringae]MDG6399146.1 hypothetical protein [Pseudomonas quasicaspiana]
MDFIWSLFTTRPKYRNYARIDQRGVCCAFKQCTQPPAGQDWVEVTEQNLSWLNKPLPLNARITRRAGQPAARQLHMA